MNRLQTLEVSRRDQVWVGNITYVRLKKRFIHVALLMDVFTHMIRGWHMSQHLTQSLTLKPLQKALLENVSEIHHSDQGGQYLSSAYISVFKHHGIKISIAHRGCPWENGYAERLIRTLPSRRKKSISTTIRISTKREDVSVILLYRCIIRNVRIQR